MIFFKSSLQKSWEKYNKEISFPRVDGNQKDPGLRFYEFTHVFLILLVYELLILFSFNEQAIHYNRVDVWFWFFHTYFPLLRWALVLGTMIYIGGYLYTDLKGIKDKFEVKWDGGEKKKNKNFKPKPKSSVLQKVNWYYWGVMMLEGFVYGSLIFVFLGPVSYYFIQILSGDVIIPHPFDINQSMRGYQNNPFQDLAVAFGAGFYEEIIFRILIFVGLLRINKLSSAISKKKWFPSFDKAKTLDRKFNYIKFKIPDFKAKDSGSFSIIMLGTLIYVFSHYILPFSDSFSLFTMLYRFVFGILLFYIFVKRDSLSIIAWTHIFHDLWYFVTA